VQETKADLDTVYICDWLPPDFGAVGQYSLLFARRLADAGERVVLIGLASAGDALSEEEIGAGHLHILKIGARPYDKTDFVRRLLWTIRVNTRLVRRAWPYLKRTKRIVFTGSPPLFLHWIAPANLWLRKELVYRITDFHPECAMAGRQRPSLLLNLLYRLTLFWRRRVDMFEALGHDQMVRLKEIGLPSERIRYRPDPSPVEIGPDTRPLARPEAAEHKCLLLYSGNWGLAHDTDTFVEGYAHHHRVGGGRALLWLNAVGSGADKVEAALRQRGLPFVRGTPVPAEQLASLLVTPDAHLITLSDAFVGYVLPSKVYGCIESGRPVIFIGSDRSDVHRLCVERMGVPYCRVDVGDTVGLASALASLVQPHTQVPSARGMQVASNHKER
jgi:hypothetical protein